jgi:hypothetical protein
MNTRILKRIRKKTKITIRLSKMSSNYPYEVYINDKYEESYSTLSGAIRYAWIEMKYYGLTDKEGKILRYREEKKNKKNIEDDGQTAYRNY